MIYSNRIGDATVLYEEDALSAHRRDPKSRSAPPKEMGMRMTALVRLGVLAIGAGWTAAPAATTPREATLDTPKAVADTICGYREYFGSDGKSY
jgi:hypothetical protein